MCVWGATRVYTGLPWVCRDGVRWCLGWCVGVGIRVCTWVVSGVSIMDDEGVSARTHHTCDTGRKDARRDWV